LDVYFAWCSLFRKLSIKRNKLDSEDSPDKPNVDKSNAEKPNVLQIPITVCGKCNKKIMPKCESIQYNLFGAWVLLHDTTINIAISDVLQTIRF